jgi:CRISPR system Cascade subunit CasA
VEEIEMTSLNLIRDPWIPVRHRSGRRSIRAPWDVLGDAADPAVAVAGPRADFDGGIVQLLIGLLQTVMPPRDPDEWLERMERPPDAGELRRRLEPLAGSFELLGPAPRFQQDVYIAVVPSKTEPIEKLLIDFGSRDGRDHFVQNGSVGALCLPCTAAALATFQTSAPKGGSGHLTSLRGGSPLTTLVVSAAVEASLWMTLWLNVMPSTSIATQDASALVSETLLPWLRRTKRTNESQAIKLTPDDCHPYHFFFAMPRRIWLREPVVGDCGVCGAQDLEIIRDYSTRPRGIKYIGSWTHSLSPYRRLKSEERSAVKGDADGIGYRHWLGLVVAPDGAGVRPALPVQELLRDRDRLEAAGDLRLWAFGYAMNNMKAKAWSESLMPIYEIPPELAAAYADDVRKLVEGAELARSCLRFAFKKLVARRPKDVKRDPAHVSAGFWEHTESRFYEIARELVDVHRRGEDAEPLRERWHRDLVGAASALFEREVAQADFRASDPAQVARAWNEMRRALYGKKMKQTLDLPVERPSKGESG